MSALSTIDEAKKNIQLFRQRLVAQVKFGTPILSGEQHLTAGATLAFRACDRCR